MPQIEVKYSDDLRLDSQQVFQKIEEAIKSFDPKAGQCKGRAYPTAEYLQSHLLLEVSILAKDYRDAAYTKGLLASLETALLSCLRQKCAYSLELRYAPSSYVTGQFEPQNSAT